MNAYHEILSQVPPDYYESGVRSNPFQWVWHTWKFRNLLKSLNGVEGKILDVGCADGSLTSQIATHLKNSKVTGVDLYKESIAFAKKKWPQAKFVVGDARKLPFKNGAFDAVICVETLEHVPDNHIALKEINRVLKKNGHLIVCQDTDSRLFNFIWYFWTKWKGKVWVGAHISCMKPKELENFLKKGGFKIENKFFSHFGLEVTFKTRKK